MWNPGAISVVLSVIAVVGVVAITAVRLRMHRHVTPGRHHLARTSAVAALGVAAGLSVQMLAPAAPAFAAGVPVTYYAGNAGYDVYSTSVPPANASVQFQVPTLSCAKGKQDIGFGILLENTSGGVSQPIVDEACAKGKPVYTAFILINSSGTTLSTTVHANDLISLSASQTAAGTSATFTDNTTGFSSTLTGPGSTPEYAFIGSVPGTKKVPVFSTFTFTNARVNGASLGTYTGATGLSQAIQTKRGKTPPKGTVEIQSGTLGLSSFSLTWVSA